MTKTLTIESLFAEIDLELNVARITHAIKRGFVRHDTEVAEVVSKFQEEYTALTMVVIDYSEK